MSEEASGRRVPLSPTRARLVLGILFTVTGCVGLLFEQALEKLIATVIGGSTPAAAIVLAVYFSGLAAGGGLYARFGSRWSRPLRTYAVLEAFVGAWAIFMRLLFEPIQAWSAALVQSSGDSSLGLLLIRFAVACIWILPPTLAMGASFPAIVGTLARLGGEGGEGAGRKALALFYSLNLVGAIAGTVGGAYWLLPLGGPGAALLCSFSLEIGVCAAAFWLDLETRHELQRGTSQQGRAAVRGPIDRATLLVLGLGAASGFVFFAFEVVAVHLIGTTVGTSAYAFADMLAAILSGMLISGLLVSLLGRRREVLPDIVLGVVLVFASLALLTATSYWESLSGLFLQVKPSTFAEAEAYRFLFSSLLLVPCAIGLGGIYPLLFRLPWFEAQRREWLAGALVATNACGCFCGALFAAFIAIPSIGSQATSLALAGMLALGALAIVAQSAASRPARGALTVAALVGLVAAVAQPRWDLRNITTGANVHFSPSYTTPSTDLLFAHEDTHGGVTTVVKVPGRRVLLTNGKFQGDDKGQMPAQVGFAMVPLVHVPRNDEALVIGLGTGHSAAVIADAGFRQVDVAELAPGIVGAATTVLHDLNGGVLDKANVKLHLDDGRNFVLRSRKAYDLITIEISSVWFAGATNLYAREFYEAVRDKLAADGVLQQWVQLHHIGVQEVLATLLTLRDVFEHVELYVVGGQGILLASKQPLLVRDAALRRLQALPSMAAHLAVLERRKLTDIADLPRWRLYDEAAVNALHGRFADHVRNTDMNRYLEYTTPRYQIAPGAKPQTIAALLDLLPPERAAERRAVFLQ